jgi:DNA-binding XRE family transcriptional regulator/Holliday junction resolvase-like predicted endonuclease
MRDLRLGMAIRLLRLRADLTQDELARRAGVSRWAASLVERGRLDEVPMRITRQLAACLGMLIDVVPRWQGGDLDRLLDAAHAALVERAVTGLQASGWEVWPEASFSVYGERGSIDILAWHPHWRCLLVVEVKSRIVDVQGLLSGIDRKRRLARRIAAERGWVADSVGLWMAVAEGRTNRRRVSEHVSTFGAVFDGDGASCAAGCGCRIGRVHSSASCQPLSRRAVARAPRPAPRPTEHEHQHRTLPAACRHGRWQGLAADSARAARGGSKWQG